MIRRDTAWRALGVVVFVGGCGAAAAMHGAALATLVLPIALLGLTLMINGKRVAVALRAERRGHARTAAAIHAVRRGRVHRDRVDARFDPPRG